MIRLKVFVSSVQKELRSERLAIGSVLTTDEYLRDCVVPRLFEEYPAPLEPNPRSYLELLKSCHIYLLIIGEGYGHPTDSGLSATHEEYHLAREMKLPTLVCLKSTTDGKREPKTDELIREIRADHHTYSRFGDTNELMQIVRERLKEHLLTHFDAGPKAEQEKQSAESFRNASAYERTTLGNLDLTCYDAALTRALVATAEDKDPESFSEEEINRLLHARSYAWWDSESSSFRPTIAGALLFARTPSLQLPQSKIQLDAYPLDDRTQEPFDSILLDAPLPTAIEQAVAFIRRNVANPLVIRGLKRQPAPQSYPEEVIREAVVNAVAHRDYEQTGAKVTLELFPSSLRITSPGLPPGGESIEVLASGEARSRTRNPLLVQGLSWFGYMDERGSGIRRMKRLMIASGHPDPLFHTSRQAVLVELLAKPPADTPMVSSTTEADENTSTPSPLPPEALTTDEAVLRLIQAHGFVTTQAVVQKLGVSRDTAWKALSRLVESGAVQQFGSGRGTKYGLKEVPS